MGKQQSKTSNSSASENKIINGLADHAIKNFDIPKGIDKSKIVKELSTNKAYFQEIAKDFYEGKYKGKEDAPAYEEWEKKQLDIYGNPFETQKKKEDSTSGSQAGSEAVGTGVSEGQNTSKVEKPTTQEDWQRQKEFMMKGVGEQTGNQQKERVDPSLKDIPETAWNANTTEPVSTQQSPNANLKFLQNATGQNSIAPSKKTVSSSKGGLEVGTVPAERTDKLAMTKETIAAYEKEINNQLKADPVQQADYFLGKRFPKLEEGGEGFNLYDNNAKQAQVDMSLNYNPDLPETEQQQIYSKLIAQDNQFMRDSGRGSNMDYIKSKTDAGDYSSKDQFKRYQQAFSTRMNALNAKIQSMSKDEGFMQKYQAYVQANQTGDTNTLNTLAQDPQMYEFLEAQNQQSQLQKLGDDKEFIKSQFGEEVGKEYLDDVVAQKKADIDYLVGKNTPSVVTGNVFGGDMAKNLLKQVGYSAADFLTGVASLPRMIGSPSEYGFGDKIADWANEQNEDLKAYFPEPSQIAQPIFKNKVDKDGKAIRDEKGEIVTETNWDILPYKLTRAAADLGLQIAGTKGMGSIKGFNAMRGSGTIGMGIMSFTQTYNQSFQQALAKGASREDAENFAVTNAFVTAGLESIAPNTWATKGVGMSDNLFAAMAKNGFTPNATKAFLKEFAKETGGEITEELSQGISSKMLETSMGIEQFRQKLDSDQTFAQEMKETALITLFLGGGMGIGAGRQKYSEMNNLTKAAAFHLANNTEYGVTQQKLKEQFELQNIPLNKQNEILKQLDDIKERFDILPPDIKRSKYAANIVDLQAQKEDLLEKARSPKQPDVIKDKLNEEVGQLDARIANLVDKTSITPTSMDKYAKLEASKVSIQEELAKEGITEERKTELTERLNSVNNSLATMGSEQASQDFQAANPVTQETTPSETTQESTAETQSSVNEGVENVEMSEEAKIARIKEIDERKSVLLDKITSGLGFIRGKKKNAELEAEDIALEEEKLTILEGNKKELYNQYLQDLDDKNGNSNNSGLAWLNEEINSAKRRVALYNDERSKNDLKEYQQQLSDFTSNAEIRFETNKKTLESDIAKYSKDPTKTKELQDAQEALVALEGGMKQFRNGGKPVKKAKVEEQKPQKTEPVLEPTPDTENNLSQITEEVVKSEKPTLLSKAVTPRQIQINIAAATRRGLKEKKESEVFKEFQDDYRKRRQELKDDIANKKPVQLIKAKQKALDTFESDFYEAGGKLIEQEFSNKGFKVVKVENAIGRFDEDVEPSHVITIEIDSAEGFEAAREAARQFSEKTLQDAYIVTEEINDSDRAFIESKLNAKLEDTPYATNIDMGERGVASILPSFSIDFSDKLSQKEILEIENYLVSSTKIKKEITDKNGNKKIKEVPLLGEFSISNNRKTIQFQFFTEETDLDKVGSEIVRFALTIGNFRNFLIKNTTDGKAWNNLKSASTINEGQRLSYYGASDQVIDGSSRNRNQKQRTFNQERGIEGSQNQVSQERITPKEDSKSKPASKESPPTQKGKDDSSEAKTVDKDSKSEDRKITPKNTSRNPNLKETGDIKVGKETELVFSTEEKPVKGYFAYVELDQVQASNTVDGKVNALKHFISKAQPKKWTDDRETKANKMRDNLRPDDVMGEGSSPYSGTPVLNERGEAIQGNGRVVGLGRYYKEGKDNRYKDKIIKEGERYGLNPKDAEGMKNPVLVRIVPVSDKEAIRLGQKKSTDIESGGDTRVGVPNAVTTINSHQPTRASELPALQQIANIFGREDYENRTIAQLLLNSEFVKDVLDVMFRVGAINTTERSNMLTDGLLNAKGKADMTAIFDGLSLTRGVPDSVSTMEVVDTFGTMPSSIQEAINESTKVLLEAGTGVGNSLYNAFRAYNTFRKYQSVFGTFDNWIGQTGIDVVSPVDTFRKDGVNIARFFAENSDNKKTIKEGFRFFMSHYTENLKDRTDAFADVSLIKGMNQKDAATAASAKLLEKYKPQPKGTGKAGRESRGSSTRNSQTQREAASQMVDRLKKSFPNINVEFDDNLTNSNGDSISGVYKNGKIILNPTKMTMEDALEEHAHLYLELAAAMNPTLIAEGERVIKSSPEGRAILDEVKKDYPDLSEKAQYNEAIAKAIARYGVNVKKPSAFTRFVDSMRRSIGNGLRKVLGDKSTYFTTTQRLNPGKMSLAQFSKAMAKDMLRETPLSYVDSQMLEKFSSADTSVQNITVERGLLQTEATMLDKFIGRAKMDIRVDMNMGKWLGRAIRSKESRIQANSKEVANNTYFFRNALKAAVNEYSSKSNLKGKDLKAAEAAYATQLAQDANQALRGELPSQDLPEGLRSIVNTMRSHIDRMTKSLIDEGLVPNDDLVGQFNEELSIFIRRNFDIRQKVKSDVQSGIITEVEAADKMKSITTTSVSTTKARKANENDVNITFTMQDGKKHDFTGLNSKDIYYLFGKDKGKQIMSKSGNFDVDGALLYSNPLYAVMMANMGKYVNRSYAIHRAKNLEDYLNTIDGSTMQGAFNLFANRLRNPEIASVQVQKMSNGNYSLTFQNKYGRKTDSNEFNNLTKDEVLNIISEKSSTDKDSKKARAKVKRALDNTQSTNVFEVQMPKRVKSSFVKFTASQVEINAEIKTFLSNQIEKVKGDDRTASSQKPARKNTGILKSQQDIPKELRDLMGEDNDPQTVYENTTMKMANLLHSQELINTLWQEGGEALFSDTKTNTLSSKRISADGNSAYAPLDGKHTTPEMYDLLFKGDSAKGKQWYDKAMATWLFLNGTAKAALTVYSLGSNTRNLIGAGIMTMKAGVFNPLNIPKAYQITRENVKPGKYQDFYNQGIKLGVFSQNVDAEIFKNQMDRSIGKTDFTLIENLKKFSSKVYQFPDDMAKAMALLDEIQTERKAAKHTGEEVTEQQLMERAAEKVRATLPNYSIAPKAMQNLSRNAILGSFVMFQAETLRNTWNTFGLAFSEIRSDNPVYKAKGVRRLTSIIGMLSAAPILALAMAGKIGLEDEEEEGIRAMLPDYQRNSVFLWIGRNSKEEPQYLDLSFIDPSTTFHKPLVALATGQDYNEKFKEALREVYQPFLGMEIFTKDVYNAVTNENDFGRKIAPDNSGFWGVRKRVTEAGKDLIPKVGYESSYMLMGALNEFKEEDEAKYQTYTRDINLAEEVTNNFMGTKLRTFDAQKRFSNVLFTLKDAYTNGKDLLKDKDTGVRNVSTATGGKVGEMSGDSKLDTAKKNYREVAKKAYLATKAMRKYGYSDLEILKLAKDVGFSKDHLRKILNGDLEYTPFDSEKAQEKITN